MPEGDSYVRAAARLRPVLVDRRVTSVDGVPAIRRIAHRIVGSVVESIRTNGKHILIDLDNGLTIHVWLGMPGRWRVSPAAGGRAVVVEGEGRRTRSDRGAVRLLLATDDHVAVCYAAPTVEVERRAVVDASMKRLGPDVLAESFDWEGYRDRASRAADTMAVCDFLLDQRVMAGIGNEYKNEILFLERLHPLTPLGDLGPDARDALAMRAMRLMVPNARRTTRTTTTVGAPALKSWVFERTGRPCRRCGSAIESAHLGEPHPRITYWCPRCQPEPSSTVPRAMG